MSAPSSVSAAPPAGADATVSGTSADPHTVVLVCPHCAKEFRGNRTTSGVRSNYRRHLLTHTGERPFPCTFCLQGFTTKQNLVRHVRLVHASLATPELPARQPAARNNGSTPAHMEAPLGEATPPLPEMFLPPATTSSAVTDAVAAADAETASAAPSQSTSSTTLAGLGATFTCGDCELELSSRTKLRRHQRYSCPFRDNVYADPVRDAVAMYRSQRVHLRGGEAPEGSVSDVESECSSTAPQHARRSLRAPARTARGGRGAAATMALTEEERRYLVHAAGRSGLKFVEDAYASDADSDVSSSPSSVSSSASSSSSAPSSSGRRTAMSRHRREAPTARSSPLPTPRRTPVHGPLLSAALSPSGRLARAGGGRALGDLEREVDEEEEEDAELATWAQEDLVHLQCRRRGSGRRRERHILQRRLRGQEGVLMSLLTDSPGRPSRRRRSEATVAVTVDDDEDDDAEDEHDSARLLSTPTASGALRAGAARVAAAGEPRAAVPSASSSAFLTPHVLAQAESILTDSWSRPDRGQDKAIRAFACPYCDDYTTFASRRGLTAHMSRVHAEQMANMQARAAPAD